MRYGFIWKGLTVLLLGGATTVAGQDVDVADACDDGQIQGVIGIRYRFDSGMFMRRSDEGPWVQFHSEPRITEIDSGSAADGRLREGDVITAVDGYLITTGEGSRRLSRTRPGQPVVLTVRRDGDLEDVEVIPGSRCVQHENDVFVVAPEIHGLPELEELQVIPEVMDRFMIGRAARPDPHRGWLGFSFDCGECGVETDDEGHRYWSFPDHPTVLETMPGSPAEKAGIESGDVLTHIDGRSLLTLDGGRRLYDIEPEQSVTLTLRRGEREREMTLEAGRRPVAVAPRALPRVFNFDFDDFDFSNESPVHFDGQLGGVEVEVSGMVTVEEEGDEIIIRGRGVTVRIREIEEN